MCLHTLFLQCVVCMLSSVCGPERKSEVTVHKLLKTLWGADLFEQALSVHEVFDQINHNRKCFSSLQKKLLATSAVTISPKSSHTRLKKHSVLCVLHGAVSWFQPNLCLNHTEWQTSPLGCLGHMRHSSSASCDLGFPPKGHERKVKEGRKLS